VDNVRASVCYGLMACPGTSEARVSGEQFVLSAGSRRGLP
jgi:hypothetical protein